MNELDDVKTELVQKSDNMKRLEEVIAAGKSELEKLQEKEVGIDLHMTS